MLTQRGNAAVIFLVLVLLIVVGGGGYYLGTQSTANPGSLNLPASSPIVISKTAPSPSAQTSNIPSGWTFQKNESCSVEVPIPPQAEPYTTNSLPRTPATSDNNRYWYLSQDTESQMFIFKDDAILSFVPVQPVELGNGYNPGSVSVFCAPNPDNLTADQIIKLLENDINTRQYDFKVINKGQSSKWGLNTSIINIEGGMFGENDIYIFPANERMYFVSYESNSTNQLVKDTARQIFDNLKFSN